MSNAVIVLSRQRDRLRRVTYAGPEPGAGPCRRVLPGELLATSDFVLPLEPGAVNTLRDERFAVMMKPARRSSSLRRL